MNVYTYISFVSLAIEAELVSYQRVIITYVITVVFSLSTVFNRMRGELTFAAFEIHWVCR